MESALTNREIAVGAWLIAFSLWALTKGGIASSVGGILAASLTPKLAIPALLFAAWITGAVLVAQRVGFWSTDLLKDTVIWFVVAGLVLFGRFMKITEPRFARRTVLKTIAIPEYIQFALGLVSFSLIVELLLFPILVLFGLVSAVGGMKSEHRPAKRVADWAVSFAGIAILLVSAVQLLGSLEDFDGMHLILLAYLPAWLTGAALVFVYAFGMYAHYEWAFTRVDFAARDVRARRRAKAALFLVFHVRVRRMNEYVRAKLHELVRADSFRDARKLAREWSPSD